MPMPSEEVKQRLAQCLSDEALLCLREGVASSAKDIDLAMVLGTGYAPFRGGPLAGMARV
jgi:3-hydroxyacyl-CoA dehydrogenase / enoyl-CoA hydratase / 3-hydroxybutyryl-CoA epimerase